VIYAIALAEPRLLAFPGSASWLNRANCDRSGRARVTGIPRETLGTRIYSQITPNFRSISAQLLGVDGGITSPTSHSEPSVPLSRH